MKKAINLRISGLVQGVGFRPSLYRLASSLHLKGRISNTSEGVIAVLEGSSREIEVFLKSLPKVIPPQAKIHAMEIEECSLQNFRDLKIEKSEGGEKLSVDPLPDLAICRDCERELFDPTNRRFLYPFIACTSCGPRFSYILKLPYERESTVMKYFSLCPDCEKEYNSPEDRRFHAEPIACPRCGPRLSFLDHLGRVLSERYRAILDCAQALQKGAIVALKGLTGFHLLVRADNVDSIVRLKEKKGRKRKPFAVMFKDESQLREYVEVSEEDILLLRSEKAPILIVKSKGKLPEVLAEGLNCLGVFLPYTPLHKLLLDKIDFPVVATSGNIAGEPLIFEDNEALSKLSGIADFFLLHNRPIVRPLDDSVIKKRKYGYIPIRRSRGYVPSPIVLKKTSGKCVLAVGAQERTTFSLLIDNRLIISQHLGDLDTFESQRNFERIIKDYLQLYGVAVELIVSDLHPDYFTTKWAKGFAQKLGIPHIQVQHHYAHVLALLAEKGIIPERPILGIAWDGIGFGLDGTLWGGEFLLIKGRNFERLYSLRPFRLLGGERAIKDTKRVALSILFEIFGEEIKHLDLPFLRKLSDKELNILFHMWKSGLNSPITSSVGRLIDAVSALLGISYENSYSGESAMKLEALYDEKELGSYPFEIKDHTINWTPTILGLLEDRGDLKRRASRFLNTLSEIALAVAQRVGVTDIALTGGVMMNAPLVDRMEESLRREGFQVLIHREIPPNDGGISAGQAYFALLMDEFAGTDIYSPSF